MQLVILAGGPGKRLGLRDAPKPMVEIDGKPLLERQIVLARDHGIRDITILSGFRADVIQSYLGDGRALGVNIRHVVEPSALGTAGAVRQIAGSLPDPFLVFYGDIAMDFDVRRLVAFSAANRAAIATIVVHPNDHPFDSDLVAVDDAGRISALYAKPHPADLLARNLVSAGVYVLSPRIVDFIPPGRASDFGRDVFPALTARGEHLQAYVTTEYLKDLGTPERLAEVRRDITSERAARMRRGSRRTAVFLDRDGVLNEDIEGLRAEDYALLDGAAAAVRGINESGRLAIVVTNQSAIAKGLLTFADAHRTRMKLETLLGHEHAYLDDYYFCPHHPDAGFPGEVHELKIACDCRKPLPGMILRAAADHAIDLGQSWMIGDRDRDMQAGRAAGCHTVMVGHDRSAAADRRAANLREAVDLILATEAAA